MSVPWTADVFVAERNAQRDYTGAIEAAQHGLWLSITLVVPAMVLVWWLEPILRATGQSPAIATLAQRYTIAVSPAFIAWAACVTAKDAQSRQAFNHDATTADFNPA
jgi:Na+-driven multidrug efflux pump